MSKCVLLTTLICFSTSEVLADNPPDWYNYQIKFPPSPSGAADALASLGTRADAVATFMACGSEIAFFHNVSAEGGPANDEEGNGENLTAIIVGKMLWLMRNARNPRTSCSSTVNFHRDSVLIAGLSDFLNPGNVSDAMNPKMAALYGTVCGDRTIYGVEDVTPTNVTITFFVTPQCMRAQINLALSRMQRGNKQFGSTGLPCSDISTTKGEWDVTVRDLTRILYLSNQNVSSLLDPSTRTYIEEQLISLSSSLGESSYSWLQCGDTENTTGSPQERADEPSWVHEAVDSIADALKWLALRLLLILAFITVVVLIADLLAGLGITGVVIGTAAQVGAAAAVFGAFLILTIRIPESENHRFMIESSRFLKNERSISALGPSAGSNIMDDQSSVKQLLMGKLKDVLSQDFSEYNARPYQRYSLESLLNLADFSVDKDVQLGASMVLEYALTKFALGSNQGRRLVPFRRLMNEVQCIVAPCSRDGKPIDEGGGPMEEFALSQGADHLTALGLFFTGQTQHLLSRRVSVYSAAEMVYAASSRFSPDPLVLDLAIRKDFTYFQRIHHSGFEVYSSAPSAFITAGGIQTEAANKAMAGPIPLGSRIVDNGAASPTTMMFTREAISGGTESRMTAPSYLRFEGLLQHYDDKLESFDHNLCVWRNFACGTNLRIPSELSSCFKPAPPGAPRQTSGWLFLDSTACAETKQSPPFFLALFRVCANSTCSDTGSNAGFIEVADSPAEPLGSFITRVARKNPDIHITPACLPAGTCTGIYHSVSGHDIGVNLFGHQADSKRSGIESIDGTREKDIDEWQFAEGDVITAAGDGLVKIKNPHSGSSVQLDLRDITKPLRH